VFNNENQQRQIIKARSSVAKHAIKAHLNRIALFKDISIIMRELILHDTEIRFSIKHDKEIKDGKFA